MSTITANNITKVDGKPVLGWTLLSTTVASSDSTIDVINLSSDYFMYKFFWYGLKPSTNQANVFIRTSTNNGSSWDTGSSDYAHVYQDTSMETIPTHSDFGDDSDDEMQAANECGSAANETGDWEITCFNPSSTEYTKFKWEGVYYEGELVHGYDYVIGSGVRRSAADVNGVRFLMSTGNIASGTLKVYGIRA